MPDNRSRANGDPVLADRNALRAIGAHKTDVHRPTFSEPHMRSKPLALTVRSPASSSLDCWDRDHPAVITFAPQPAEKAAFEQLGVETSGLGAPLLTRYRNA
jgi:hypothetical protein